MRYLYQETTEKENLEISKALLADNDLKQAYQQLVMLKQEMDATQLQPSSSAVLNILSYARNIQEKRT